MKKQFTKKDSLIILIGFIGIILFGIGLGLLYSSLPAHHPEKSKQACESVGGEWTDEQICLLSYKQAGEVCTDGGQCISGVCFPPELTEEQKVILAKEPLKNIVGTCYPEDLVTGCVEQVILGTVSKESMCMD
ncbi:MAG: hypothetical protein ABIB43_04735 [archaeon]